MTLVMVLSLAGCNHRMRMYSMDKPRVDQELPPGSDDSGRKKTRKAYYLEITKEADETKKKSSAVAEKKPGKEVTVKSGTDEEEETDQDTGDAAEGEGLGQEASEADTSTSSKVPDQSMNFASTARHAPAESAFKSPVNLPTQYTIEKDDTLQSIAKKFYGSFGKWVKIYNANKDVIADPNRIKPGTKIKIPKL